MCVFFIQDLLVLFDKLCWECGSVDNATDMCVFYLRLARVVVCEALLGMWQC